MYILNPALLLLLCWALWRQPCLQSVKKHVVPALCFKLVAGILLGLLYHHYYREGDTLTYQKASLILTDYAKENLSDYMRLILFNKFESENFRTSIPFSMFPDFSNSFFFIKLLSLLNLLTGSQYYLNSLYLSIFSFWGTATLVTTLVKYFPKYKPAAIVAFLYFPSVVFWSSGVLKDAILFGSMCWVIAIAIEMAEGNRLSIINWLLLPFMVFLFYRIKFFLALILLPLLILYFFIRLIRKKTDYLRQVLDQAVVLLIGFGVVVILGVYLEIRFNDAFFLHNLVDTYEGILTLSQNKPHAEFFSLEPTLPSILLNAPEALFNAVYRPFVWEAVNVLYLLMSLENLLFLVLSILALVSIARNGMGRLTLLHICFVLIIICFGIIIGLSTPNFGTLSRYRIVFLPFLIYLLLQNQYTQKLLSKLQF